MTWRALVALGIWTMASGIVVTVPQTVFRGRTESVEVDVSVRSGNAPVPGLRLQDFRIRDNGIGQTVESVSLGAVPIDVTILIDTSGTTMGDLDHLKDDARTMAAMLRPDDRIRLLTFTDQIHDVFGWQRPTDDLQLDTVGESTDASPIYDALLLALLHQPDVDRRHLVVALTDGLDNGSWVQSATVRDIARVAEGVLHVVIVPVGSPNIRDGAPSRQVDRSHPDAMSDANLEEATTVTGGQFHRAPVISTRNRVVNAFRDAFEDFRLSYVLRFTPKNVPLTGWHELSVGVNGYSNYTIRARKGYFGG